MKLSSTSLHDGAPIPSRFAFCASKTEMGGNVSPHLAWADAPEGTQSFAVICHDPDVPSRPDDVNQEGKTVPHDLPRVDFFHWVLVDIPASISELPEGLDSTGITPKGKATGVAPIGVRGFNNYTQWFEGDEAMGGMYGGYDGPCPPWNDERLHHYHFTVYALDVPTLGLTGIFSGPDALAAMDGHILASAGLMGTYTLNPDVQA